MCASACANAHLAIRHDAYRFMPPGSPRYVGKDVVNYFWPEQKSDAHSAQADDVDQRRDLAAELTALRRLRSELAVSSSGSSSGGSCGKGKSTTPTSRAFRLGILTADAGRARAAPPLPLRSWSDLPDRCNPTIRRRFQNSDRRQHKSAIVLVGESQDGEARSVHSSRLSLGCRKMPTGLMPIAIRRKFWRNYSRVLQSQNEDTMSIISRSKRPRSKTDFRGPKLTLAKIWCVYRRTSIGKSQGGTK